MTTSVAAAGEVTVEGEHLGRIEGFRFVPDAAESHADQKAVMSAALRALRQDLPERLQAFAGSADGEIVFDSQLRVCWGGGPVARLLPSGDILAPKVEALATDLLDGPAREEVRKRAATWVETRIRLGLSELMDARATTELPAGARGVVFQLCESLGVLSRRPIEDQLTQLGEDDRKALARLGVRVGVYSIYFPSMLKPVPIRLRAGLWMIARNRETIPPLPAEGRTSMDLPRDAEREFYATIGYLPLGNHAIRADMVERLAAMARQAVRESRETVRRAQQDRKPAPRVSPAASAAPETTSSTEEISEWAIVAAAFGESEAVPVPEAAVVPEVESPPTEAVVAPTPEPSPIEASTAEPSTAEPETTELTPVGSTTAEPVTAESAAPESTGAESTGETSAEPAVAEEGPKAEAKTEGPRPLQSGYFRATPQMMSLVGCSEPEMANVMQALGYRVHPPTEESGPLHSFSMKPRFVREREEQRERQRLQQRQQREQQRRERPERPPNERQFFADAPRNDGPRQDRGKGGPRSDAPRNDGPRQDGPRQDGPRKDGPRKDGPRQDRGHGDRPRGARPPRRDSGGPALRLYATTETKSDTPAADSPFAKLLELKLGGKK